MLHKEYSKSITAFLGWLEVLYAWPPKLSGRYLKIICLVAFSFLFSFFHIDLTSNDETCSEILV